MNSIEKEKRTIERFIYYYCKCQHGSEKGELCHACKSLLAYCIERLDSCPFGDEKLSCRQCQVHCYDSQYREKIREVMRYCGPRSIWFMPMGYIKHWHREFKKSI